MRKPMITRTVNTTVATIVCANTDTMEVFEKTVELPRTYKNEKALVKAIVLDGFEKVLAVKDTAKKETLYGMTESEFVKHADILPTRE